MTATTSAANRRPAAGHRGTALEQLAGRRILFINWRDLDHPSAGGAEAYTERIARRVSRLVYHDSPFVAASPSAPRCATNSASSSRSTSSRTGWTRCPPARSRAPPIHR